MQRAGEHSVKSERQTDADEGQLIGCGDDAAFSFGVRAMLNDRHYRDREESARKPQQAEKNRDRGKRQTAS